MADSPGGLPVLGGGPATRPVHPLSTMTPRPALREKLERAGLAARNGRSAEAIQLAELAVREAPEEPMAWSCLSNVWLAAGRLGPAETAARMAVQVGPGKAELHHNLGVILHNSGQLSAAAQAFETSLRLRPGQRGSALSLGAVLRRLGRLVEAEVHLRPHLSAAGLDGQTAQWNLALVRLMAGDPSGWQLYEARKNLPGFAIIQVAGPDWDGREARDKVLLVVAEQGLGDSLQFSRYLARARPLVGRLVFAVQAPLVGLFQAAGLADEVLAIPKSREPGRELRERMEQEGRPWVSCALLSLPALLGPGEGEGGSPGAYLKADLEQVEAWRLRLGPSGGRLRVGITFQGNPAYGEDRERSIPLAHFQGLARRDDLRLFSLQKVHGTEQVAAWPSELRLYDLGPELDEERGPFGDTPAVLCALDLLISSDTATLHLAGALGVPTIGLLARFPDWRFGLKGERLPEYPNVRLLRQRTPGDWPELFERLGVLLDEQFGGGQGRD